MRATPSPISPNLIATPASRFSPSRLTPATKPHAPVKAGQLQRRDSVQHASFGVGKVIESTMTREGEEVTVAFPGVGIKKLMAEYLRKM